MIANILRADAQHAVRTPAAYAERHGRALARLRAAGVDALPREDADPIAARIDTGRWLFDCRTCRAGVAAHPDWPVARCFGCGAVYPGVVFPADREALEAVLTKRPAVTNRFWVPGETLDALRAENLAHGLPTDLDEAVIR